ncbi:hypothetical protein F4553_003375 [Allocatelliglobosispora scoriae]|uniref:Uncharacterized protein n=1 Tax=Allocatelliglobosispora scoriae TaxID=643052 RepID=A0A841BRI8_9ACTN|nr:hypothetical protein [Allocatelliglobosispora scoriae]MBB5869996.1 hypothetical protein [Allocatelliglobosispora scoriae]
MTSDFACLLRSDPMRMVSNIRDVQRCRCSDDGTNHDPVSQPIIKEAIPVLTIAQLERLATEAESIHADVVAYLREHGVTALWANDQVVTRQAVLLRAPLGYWASQEPQLLSVGAALYGRPAERGVQA